MPTQTKHNPMLDTRRIGTLRQLVDENAALYGDDPVYVYKDGKEKKEYTYRQMKENSDAVGSALARLGLSGKNIAVFGEAHPAYMTVFYAVVNGGGVIIPLDKEISDDELVNFLKLSEATAVFYMPGQNGRLEQRLDELPALQYLIPVKPAEGASSPRLLPYESLLEMGRKALAEGEKSYISHEIDRERCCEIIFTSGTTGTSKGVMLSQKNLCAATMASCDSIDYLYRGVRLVSVLPMNHTYEVTCSHLAAQYFGAVTFLNDSLKYVARNIKEFRPNILVLVPLFLETMHKKIWDEVRKKDMEKKVRFAIKLGNGLARCGLNIKEKLFREILAAFGGQLQSVIAGGAAVNPMLITDFRAFGISVQEGYGITECAPLVAVNLLGKERLHSVGRAVPGCVCRIDKKDPSDETGEIVVKGDNVMLGYYRNEEATAEVFTEDGWFRTGDIGYMDADGYIFITGRKKNVIILSNGKNIFPEELEEHLGQSDLILECAVIGRAKDGGEPVITALIYPNYDRFKGKSKEEIEAAIRQEVANINRTLPQYKHIQGVEVRETEFEKTTTRKIKRYKLQ